MKEDILTAEEAEMLRHYLQEIEKINEREPKHLTAEVWKEVQLRINAAGEIPAEYRNRIAKGNKGYYDAAWEEWNNERLKIESQYHKIIIKALRFALSSKSSLEERTIIDLLRDIINDDENITAEQVRAALPQLASIILQKHLIPNNKLANSLTKDIIDIGLVELDMGRKKGDIITRCILSYSGDNVKLTSRQSFTEYDRQVSDAVTSLYEYGDESHIITAATVYRTMVHATETETPSPQQIEAVTRSLDKMRFVRVQIDCTEELKRRNIEFNGTQITGGKIDTYLLALDKMEVIAGGQKVVAYKVIKTPILYEYSRLTGQVITVPANLLDIRDKSGARIANTERRIAIKGYLMRRISIMKGQNGTKQSRHIIFESLYSDIGETHELSRRDQQLIRDYAGLVLDNWKREHFIKDYRELTKGKKKIGIEIKI